MKITNKKLLQNSNISYLFCRASHELKSIFYSPSAATFLMPQKANLLFNLCYLGIYQSPKKGLFMR